MSRRNKKECPNPLFLKWLEEWKNEAKEKNTKLQYTYAKAAASLRKYPLPLSNGAEAMILDHIGGMVARKLDEALAKYNASSQEPVGSIQVLDVDLGEVNLMTESLRVPPPASFEVDCDMIEKSSPKKRKQPRQKVSREYIPAYKTGPYALILTLYRQSQEVNYRGFMSKSELQRDAQALCDTSFTVPDPGKHYTAWSSMSTLIKKGYIIKTNNPSRYSITDGGCVLAQKLETVSAEDSLPPSLPSSTAPFATGSVRSPSSAAAAPRSAASLSDDGCIKSKIPRVDLDSYPWSEPEGRGFTRIKEKRKEELHVDQSPLEDDVKITGNPEFVLRPGTFDIVLCVDTTETTGGAAKSRKDSLVPELKNNGVQFDVRKLQLGDFLWIARERTTPTPGCLMVPVARELVLDHIVERKRMDDLCGSIIDGRFREQKFRLRHCGLKHPIYLVEDFGSTQHMSLPESTLQQAIVNTQVVDGFFMKRTHDLKESVAYLTVMTRYLQRLYKNKTLVSCHQENLEQATSSSSTMYLMAFQEFNDSSVKNKVMTVSEVFAEQLMQLSGVSADKAAAILEKYPTPKKLLDAYGVQITDKDREMLLSTLKAGKNQRNLGPSLSKLIYQLFCSASLT